ncbi:uncharacterized protein LOC141595333 [Silene latifolia]|uniref:uncharacterized protein LOC141595333 n=1 Tax=Silene latifolia TaxID=37657 RepID=UPI003D77C20D
MNLSFVPGIDSLTIEEEDIVKEVEYWQTTLVGTVLGKQSTLVQIESLVSKFWTHITTPEIMYFAKDEHTTNKSKLAFARVLIDVDLSKELPKAIKLNTPYRGSLLQAVAYEWVPHFCSACKKVGHTKDRWTIVSTPKEIPPKSPVKKTVATNLSNRFSVLQPDDHETEEVASDDIQIVEEHELDMSDKGIELDLGEPVDCGALIETHVKHKSIKDVSQTFSGYNLVHNNDSHYNGRIWIFWKPHILTLTVLHQSPQHMHCLLLHIASQKLIEVTFVYAFNARQDRRELWDQLISTSTQVTNPWLCLGDFNVVLNMDERLGSSHVQLADINEFKHCLDVCNLVDHPATGYHFTWNNKQGDGLRWAKLDRILASSLWLTNIHSTATFLSAGISDHSPCKLKRLRGYLSRLHTSHFSNLSARVAERKKALQHCQDLLNCSPLDPSLIAREHSLLQEYLLVKRAEMQALYQRAKVQNLQLNDLSTRFFYSRLADRRARNSIGIIQDENGKQCTGSKEVSLGFISYYKSLLCTSSPVLPLPPSLFLQDTVPPDSCTSLIQQIRVQEIIDALKSIDRHKSPGIDGYTSGFFLDAWQQVGSDFKAAVFDFFQNCFMPKAANATLLVLIPKMETPLTVKDYRPIACCTTFYKVVSKILANRLQQVLDFIIGPEQAAFVANRDIFDNTMLAHELVSKYGRAHLTPRYLLKVDIRKAFDSMNWGFLKDSLTLLKFPPQFIQWIMACITSPHYSLLINGEVHGFFPGKCGLRQGDPLSPYLFVICMEVLSRLLRRLPRAVSFSYHPKCVHLNLTHLVFADDLLVCTRGDLPSVAAVAKCLDQFSQLSGLHANPSKTDLYLGGITDEVRDLILTATVFSLGSFPFRYLGLPLFNARITQGMYQPLLDKIKGRVMHWANASLSYAGKTLLVNSVIFGLNNFWGASVFLPKGIAKRITKICKDFLWGIEDGARRHVFMKLQLLCSPKLEGAIGIKEVLSWNCAQMIKWV